MRYTWHGVQPPSTEQLRIAYGERLDVRSTVRSEGGEYAYEVVLDSDWAVLALTVEAPDRRVRLRRERDGTWFVDDTVRPDLAAAVDVDLAFSPFTNTLPIRRLGLAVGAAAEVVTAYVDAPSLLVTPDPQRYTRLEDRVYLYESLDSDFSRRITVDDDGFVVDYPGLFRRAPGPGDPTGTL
ncbi:MAG TPA: putative glycolipid-binding domain-containing protein [Phototrophicaceae bacterium]|nr:putative glycolipid-binding domain-containing protein [Phototrophicaceae bacterium]